MGSQRLAMQTSSLERIANDGTASDQSPTRDEAKGRGCGVEGQHSCQSGQA